MKLERKNEQNVQQIPGAKSYQTQVTFGSRLSSFHCHVLSVTSSFLGLMRNLQCLLVILWNVWGRGYGEHNHEQSIVKEVYILWHSWQNRVMWN